MIVLSAPSQRLSDNECATARQSADDLQLEYDFEFEFSADRFSTPVLSMLASVFRRRAFSVSFLVPCALARLRPISTANESVAMTPQNRTATD